MQAAWHSINADRWRGNLPVTSKAPTHVIAVTDSFTIFCSDEQHLLLVTSVNLVLTSGEGDDNTVPILQKNELLHQLTESIRCC